MKDNIPRCLLLRNNYASYPNNIAYLNVIWVFYFNASIFMRHFWKKQPILNENKYVTLFSNHEFSLNSFHVICIGKHINR